MLDWQEWPKEEIGNWPNLKKGFFGSLLYQYRSCNSLFKGYYPSISCALKLHGAFNLALGDTQNDSIQSLNFGKNWFNSIFDSIMADQNSIQTIIQFNNIGRDSIQVMIKFKCQVIINIGRKVQNFVTKYSQKWLK